MADIKSVIKIPEEMIKSLEQGSFGTKYNMYDLVGCVMNGTPLDKVIEDIKAEIETEREQNLNGEYDKIFELCLLIIDKHRRKLE